MSVKTAELTFTDGMHFETATGSGRRFAYDDPPEGGLGPVETVLTSLAACSAMDVISVALKKRQDIERYTIHVRGDQREAYPQVYTRIDLVHEVVGATASQSIFSTSPSATIRDSSVVEASLDTRLMAPDLACAASLA